MSNSMTNLHAGSPLNILVVEDENIVALDLRSILTYLGYVVVGITGYGEEAVSLVRSLKPDAVMMDIGLRGEMDGVEAAQIIREEMNTPVVFITANADAATLHRAKITQPYGFILKPFDEREIQTTLEMAFFRYKTDQELRESRQWLATTLESIGDAVIATDRQGNIKFMNPIAEKLSGWAQPEAIGRPLPEVFVIVNDATRNPVENPVEIVLKEGRTVGLANHTVLIAKDGKEYNIDDAASPIHDRKGDITGVVLTFRDITEKYKSEAALLASEKRFRSLIENSEDMITLVDADGAIVYGSPAVERVLGFSFEEYKTKVGFDFIHPDDRPLSIQKFMNLLEHPNETIHLQHRLLHKNGEWVWIEGAVTNLLADPDIKAIVSNFRDITARKNSEQALTESYTLLKAVTEGTDDIIFVKDIEGKYLLVNSRGKKISGYTPDEMIGKTDADLFSQELAQAATTTDRSVVETRTNLIVESTVEVEGEQRIYMTSKNPLYDNENTIIGVVGVARDITELKNAQKDLRKNEELFRAMIEDSADGVSLTSKEGKIIYSSPANPKILGYTPEERLNGGFTDLLHPEDAPRVTAMFQEMMSGAKDSERFEVRAKHKDGAWHWIEVNCRNMASNPSVNAIVSNFRDITARKNAEQALLENYGLLKAMTEATGDVIFMKDIEGRYIFINAAGAKIARKTKAEILGKTDLELFDAETAKVYRDIDTLVIETGRGCSQEYDSTVDGQVHNFITSKNPIRDANKKVIGTVGISRDITELKNAQKDLRKNEELFRAMVEDSNNGITLIDEEGKIIYSSPANYKVLGYFPDEQIGKNFKEMVHPDDMLKVENYTLELFAGKKKIEPFEIRALHKDNSERWLEVSGQNMFDNPSVRAIVVNFQDITGRKVTAEKLSKSEQTLSDIVEAITVPMVITGIENKKILYGNHLIAEMAGLPLEELYNHQAIDFYVNPEEREQAVQELLETGVLQNKVVRMRRATGEFFWGVLTSRIIMFDGQNAIATTIYDITEQKKAEEEVVKSNERFEMIANATDDVVWDWSLVDNSIWWNKNFYLHLGYDENNKDLTINSWLNGLHPLDKERVTVGIHHAIDSGENYWTDEYCFLKADGSEVFVLDRGYILYNSEGKPYRMVGAMVDITEHKTAEEKIKLSEEKYRLMFDHNPQPMWIYDTETLKFLEVNQAAVTHYGYSRDEFLNMTIKDIRPQEDIPLLMEDLATVTDDYSISGEWRHLKKNGEVIYTQITSHVIVHNGRPARHILVNDITDRKKTEQALQENYTLLKTITEGINESIFAKDTSGNYIFINSAAAKILNKTKEEIIGHDDAALFSPEHASWLMEVDRTIIATGKPQVVEGYFDEGVPHYYIDSRYPFYDAVTGEISGVVGISRDISEQKKTESKLRLYERALQSVGEGLVIIDAEQQDNPTAFANEGFYAMTGYLPEEVLGKNRDFLQGKATDMNVELEMRNSIANNENFKGEILNYKKDGTPFWNYVRISPVPNEAGKVTHFIGLLTDIDDRKKAEAKLRLYERALQSVNDGVIITNAELSANPTVFANEGFYAMTGYLPEEVLGKNRNFLQGKATDENVELEMRNSIANNENFKGEILNYKKDGTAFWNYVRISPVPNETGEVTHFIGLLTDIDDRKKAEAKLRLYERALQSVNDGVIITNAELPDNPTIFANDAFCSMIGYEREEVLGKNRDFLRGEATDKDLDEEIRNTIAKNNNFKGEILNYKKDGTPFWNFLHISPVPNENGAVTHFIGLHIDISDRKKAEEKLRLYERALQSIITGVVITDAEQPDNPIVFVNESFYDLTGYSPYETLGRNCRFLQGEETDKEIHVKIKKCLDENKYFEGEILNYKKDGTPFWNFLRIAPVPNESGKVTHFVGFQNDITGRKLAEDKIRNSELQLAEAQRLAKYGNWNYDCINDTLTWSEELYNVFGTDKNTFIETHGSFVSLVDESDRESVLATNRKAIDDGQPFRVEYHITTPIGEKRIIEEFGQGVLDSNGKVIRLFGTAQNITERKVTEEIIKESEEKYRSLVENSPDVIITLDRQNNIQFINRTDEGMVREQVIGQNVLNFIAHEYHQLALETYQKVYETGTVQNYEVAGQGASGSVAWFITHAGPIFSGKDVVGITLVTRDITARKNAEEELRNNEKNLLQIIDAIAVPMLVTSFETGKILYANQLAIDMEESQKGAFVGQSAADYYSQPEDREILEGLIKEHGFVRNQMIQVRSKTDELISILFSASTITFNGEKALVATMYDISDQKNAEDELRKSEKNLHQIIEAITVPMVVTSVATGRVVYANQLIADMLGVPMEAVLQQQAKDFYADPDDRTVLINMMKSQGYVQNHLLQMLHKAGKLIWVLLSGRIITFDGEPSLVITMYDVSEQKQAQDKLRESEELFRAMIENSTDGVTLIDSKGILTYMSPNGEKIIGSTCEELNDLGYLSFIHPDDRDSINEKFEKLLEGQEFLPTPLRWNYLGKEWRWIVTRGSNLVENPSIRSIIMNFRDITEQKRADEELITSQARLRGVIDSAMDAIITIDSNQNIILINKSAEKMFLCSAEEVLGTSVERFIPHRYRTKHTRLIQEFGKGNVTSRSVGDLKVLNGLRSNGEEFPIEASISQIDSIAGKLFTVILRDVTERRKAERQIYEQAALLEIVPDAIIMRELDGKVIYWNSGAAKMYGWAAADAIGKSVLELISTGETTDFYSTQKILLERDEWTGEFIQRTKTNQKILVQSRWKLVRNAKGEPTSVLVTNTDITEKRNLEQQFLRTQRLESIGTLASGIAHDLNNILTPVVLGMELLKTRHLDDVSMQRIDTIIGIVKRGSGLISQVLDFARGTKGENVPINPKYIVMEVAKVIRETFPRQIDIDVNITKDDISVLGDGTQIHQVLMNLCINARDAMPKGGKLDISVALQTTDDSIVRQNINAKIGRYVVITVRDSGEGIPVEIRDRIFDPFFTTKAEGKGTGLGLATVFTIVKNHGGFINLYSEIGNGTSFKIYLPVHISSEAVEIEEETAVRDSGKQELILVVDDEELIRTISADILLENGYLILTAQNGAEAVQIYREKKDEIAVIVTDVMMPVMNGIELIEIVQGINPDVKIVAASGLMQGDIATKLAAAKVSARLAKPFTADKLLAAVHQALQV